MPISVQSTILWEQWKLHGNLLLFVSHLCQGVWKYLSVIVCKLCWTPRQLLYSLHREGFWKIRQRIKVSVVLLVISNNFTFRLWANWVSNLLLLDSACHQYLIQTSHKSTILSAYTELFLLCFSSSCVPYAARFFKVSIFWLPLQYSLTFIFTLYSSVLSILGIQQTCSEWTTFSI